MQQLKIDEEREHIFIFKHNHCFIDTSVCKKYDINCHLKKETVIEKEDEIQNINEFIYFVNYFLFCEPEENLNTET